MDSISVFHGAIYIIQFGIDEMMPNIRLGEQLRTLLYKFNRIWTPNKLLGLQPQIFMWLYTFTTTKIIYEVNAHIHSRTQPNTSQHRTHTQTNKSMDKVTARNVGRKYRWNAISFSRCALLEFTSFFGYNPLLMGRRLLHYLYCNGVFQMRFSHSCWRKTKSFPF